MKKILYLLISFAIIFTTQAQNFDFNVEFFNMDINGICRNKDVVIAYGTNGNMLISSDKGQNWKQKLINNNNYLYYINKMVNVNNVFYGIGNKGCTYKSEDNGEHWNTIQDTGKIEFYDLSYDSDNIYVLGFTGIDLHWKIFIFNHNFEKTKEIPLDTGFNPNKIIIFKNKLLIPYSYKIITYDISKEYKQDSIDIRAYGRNMYKMVVENDTMFADVDGSLYKIFNLEDNWEQIYKGNITSFYKNNSVIYTVDWTTNLQNNLGTMNVYCLSTDKKFIRNGKDSASRNTTPGRITDMAFIEDSIIIAVGIYKTIYLSTDKGKNWELKSMLYTNDYYKEITQWINERNGFYVNQNRIYKTTNAGATWLPQRYTDSLIKNFQMIYVFYMDSNGNGFAYTPENTRIYADTSKNNNFIYTKDDGDSFTRKWQQIFNPNEPPLYYLLPKYPFPFSTRIDDNFIFFVLPVDNDFRKNKLTYIIRLDTNLTYSNHSKLDSLLLLKVIKDKDNVLRAIGNELKDPIDNDNFKINKYWMMHSIDKGYNWIKDYEIIFQNKFSYADLWEEDDIFFKSYLGERDSLNKLIYTTKIYYLNNKTQKCTEIFSDTTSLCSICFKYKNKVYMWCRYNYYVSENWNTEKPTWRLVDFINKTPKVIREPEFNNGKVMYSVLRKLTPNFADEVIDNKVETTEYFWASQPYPTPARNQVRFTVYWYLGTDISSLPISIYDINGQKVEGEQNIRTEPKTSYKEDIIWNCSQVPSGVYFINIGNQNKTRAIPVLISK